MKHFAVGIVIGLVLSTSVLASPTGSSIGFNFAADEPNVSVLSDKVLHHLGSQA